MLKIRLSRTGKKSQPSFRLILQEHTASPKGKAKEILGYYLPTMDPKKFEFNQERVEYWLSVGAQPSDSVAVLLKNNGIKNMEKYIAPRNKKRRSKNAPAEEPAPAATPAAAPAPAAEETAPAEEAAPAEESA